MRLNKLLTISLCLATMGVAAGQPDAALPDPLAAGWEGASVCELLHEDEELRILRGEIRREV